MALLAYGTPIFPVRDAKRGVFAYGTPILARRDAKTGLFAYGDAVSGYFFDGFPVSIDD